MWKIIDGSTNNCSPEPSRFLVPRCKWRPINYHKCFIFYHFLIPVDTGLWFFAQRKTAQLPYTSRRQSFSLPTWSVLPSHERLLSLVLVATGNLCNLLVEIISNRPDLKVPKTGTSPMKKKAFLRQGQFLWAEEIRIDSTNLLESPPPRDFHRFPTDLCFSLGPAASDCLKMLPKGNHHLRK